MLVWFCWFLVLLDCFLVIFVFGDLLFGSLLFALGVCIGLIDLVWFNLLFVLREPFWFI